MINLGLEIGSQALLPGGLFALGAQYTNDAAGSLAIGTSQSGFAQVAGAATNVAIQPSSLSYVQVLALGVSALVASSYLVLVAFKKI